MYADDGFCRDRGLYRKKGETRHEHEERRSQDIRRGGAWTQGRDGHEEEMLFIWCNKGLHGDEVGMVSNHGCVYKVRCEFFTSERTLILYL